MNYLNCLDYLKNVKKSWENINAKFEENYNNKAVQLLSPTTVPLSVTPTFDPDPPINCLNPNCGQIRIRKSLCSSATGYVCCEINGKWSWKASNAQCKQDRDNYWKTYNNLQQKKSKFFFYLIS